MAKYRRGINGAYAECRLLLIHLILPTENFLFRLPRNPFSGVGVPHLNFFTGSSWALFPGFTFFVAPDSHGDDGETIVPSDSSTCEYGLFALLVNVSVLEGMILRNIKYSFYFTSQLTATIKTVNRRVRLRTENPIKLTTVQLQNRFHYSQLILLLITFCFEVLNEK